MIGWKPVASWLTDQPQRCTVCGDVMAGRDLSTMPNYCQTDDCPGATNRTRVEVAPVGTGRREGAVVSDYEYRAVVSENGTDPEDWTLPVDEEEIAREHLAQLLDAEPPYASGWVERRPAGGWERVTDRESRHDD